MSKLMLVLVALSVFMVVPAFANPGCKNGKFVGSYVRSSAFPDLWGDASNVNHTFVYQLNLNSDGTAYENFSGAPDVMLSGGSGTPSVGNWQCRNDGKLVVTMISALYGLTNDAAMHGVLNVPVDLFLAVHQRSTYLFAVTDDNTLTRIQARNRLYPADQDPTDPNGGILRPLNTTVVGYKKLVASDADLLAP